MIPPVQIKRWLPRDKAAVVVAVEGGELSLQEALRRYSMDEAEFNDWRQRFNAGGIEALRVANGRGKRR